MVDARWLTFHDAARATFEENPAATKEHFARSIARRFDMKLDRSVFDAGDFAVRFAHASVDRFAGNVVSFAQIRKYDERPFLVCVLRPHRVETLLANSTFIAKVSHSSQALSLTKIRGTIVGSNILRELDGIENAPPNFEVLFARHEELAWEDNLERIVECTTGILPRGEKYSPTMDERERILGSIQEASAVLTAGEIDDVAVRLYAVVDERREDILRAAAQNNVNLRGNAIEQIITGGANTHGLGDQTFYLPRGTRVFVDIKSKLRGRLSNPKLYNIDKLLRALADGRTVMVVLFVEVDLEARHVAARLVNVLDEVVRTATRVQPHWAGRGSRGVTQMVGGTEAIFAPDFEAHIDVEAARRFVQDLMNR